MADVKTIGISSIITIILALGITLGPSLFETPHYYCEPEGSILECPGGLSGGSGSRCYLNEEKTSWDSCTGGWELITDDTVIPENPINIPQPSNGQKCWKCSNEECVPCEAI